MHNDRIAQLITRKLSGEISSIELEELELLFQQYPEEQYFTEIIIEYWKSAKVPADKEDLQPDKHFQYILQSAENKTGDKEITAKPVNSFIIYLKRFFVAATVIVAVAVTYWFFFKTPAQNNKK